MFGNFDEAVKQYGKESSGKWWVQKTADKKGNPADLPLKCAIVGKPLFGCARWSSRMGAWVPCKKTDEGAKMMFAVNVYDGSRCRVLEGGQGLANAINQAGNSTAGLEHVWLTIDKEPGDKGRFTAKYAGDLSERDKAAIAEVEQEVLIERVKWADDSGFGD